MATEINDDEIETLLSEVGAEDFKTLLTAFLSECAAKLASLAHGAEEANHELLLIESHTLKSLSRTFGAVALGEACAKLEQAAQNKDTDNYMPLFEEVRSASLGALVTLKEKYLS